MGTNTQSTAQNQTQVSNPYLPTQEAIQGFINQEQAGGANLSPGQTVGGRILSSGALQLPNVANAALPTINSLVNGSAAANGVNTVNQGYNTLLGGYDTTVGTLSPYLSSNYTNPYSTPGFSTALQQMNSNITNNVNSMFSAGGRGGAGSAGGSFTPANATNPNFLSYSIAGAEAPFLNQEYNALVGQQQGATGQIMSGASNVASAANAAGAADVGLPSLALSSGLQASGALPGLYASPLTAATSLYGLPYQNTGIQESVINPLATMGGQVSGTGNSVTSQPVNPWTTGLGAGLGLLALSGGGLTPSDERLKEDIEPVGTLDNGMNVYSYRFKGSPRTEIGLLAQEVERVRPDAVANVGLWRGGPSIKMVDYAKATDLAA
jgi:Chaperone of endosialidase